MAGVGRPGRKQQTAVTWGHVAFKYHRLRRGTRVTRRHCPYACWRPRDRLSCWEADENASASPPPRCCTIDFDRAGGADPSRSPPRRPATRPPRRAGRPDWGRLSRVVPSRVLRVFSCSKKRNGFVWYLTSVKLNSVYCSRRRHPPHSTRLQASRNHQTPSSSRPRRRDHDTDSTPSRSRSRRRQQKTGRQRRPQRQQSWMTTTKTATTSRTAG